MVMSFRVSELQVLLGFAGRNKSGRKHELLTKGLQLLKSGCSPAVQMKIKELYRRRFPRKILSPSDLSLLPLQTGTVPGATALTQGSVSQLPYDISPTASVVPNTMLPPIPLLGPKREMDFQHLSPPIHPVHPDVKMKRLPFYDVYDELIKPTTLASTNSQRFEEAHFTFALTPHQVQQILTSRDLLPGAKCDYTVQIQLRFCLCETSCPQEDYFPPNLFVKVNAKLCPLPGYLPPTKNGAEPKRPSRPINITPLARISATAPNTITVNWSSEYSRNYSMSVYLVKQLTSASLLQKLRAKGIRNPDHSRALIKEKLTADPDSEIATTSLRVSLMCPLGKMRLAVPCRAITCTHLQCFDAALYLQMNEKKPTWTCPVCDKKAPYENLIIDGLFMEILNSCTDCDEIQFMEDGSWCPMKPKKEKQEVCSASTYNGIDAGSIYSTVSTDAIHSSDSNRKVEVVIDLTLDSSSDEDEPPLKKPCPVTTTAIPSAVGPKGVLNLCQQPSTVVRSPPMATVGSDYLPTFPIADYLPSYQVSSDIQGLDLYSFLQSESQHYSPSVITSSEEQDALRSSLNHLFQYNTAQFMEPLTPMIGAVHSISNSISGGSRSDAIVSANSQRENHTHNGTISTTAGGTSVSVCRPDIISLD
ncbi:E3 SUMO-protein ligase PIAS3 isoform X4 [Latimeria chalumnae]|uniref:Protein inhibitor of activated STAT 3 n=2 Tax=Latimeria chalumnae TaxID=7897 RepID=H3BCU6_LATCH|nr:PREDICTED: E3 SUMO-protein ligase PIAS3 isoform X3 [Latimeria chalumnae]XP_014341409.1 PREDICTED: E3 SUMO-protein ligase PIAS3 isoform X3 [Latimeria chalumnae]|eukprot:XP_005991728.1 PREDICTED: E3 SUMO-protein ligase PIAS3 isoform X3 [Latimeria chalumnae]